MPTNKQHHFTRKGLEWNLLTGKKPPLQSTVLVHNGHLNDERFPVVAYWDGWKFLRSSGRAYGENEGVNQWAELGGIDWPILQPGLYTIKNKEECARIFDSLQRRFELEGKRVQRPRMNRTQCLNHLDANFTAGTRSVGAKRLGFNPANPYVNVFIFDEDYQREDRFFVPEVYEVELMVECECGHGLTDYECMGKDPPPTPAEIEERKSSQHHDPASQQAINDRLMASIRGRSND